MAAALLIGPVAWRDHKNLRDARRRLLDGCSSILADSNLTFGGDGFPRLRGRVGSRAVQVDLIPDTMTIRRLPQLWLSVTLLDRLPIEADVAVLVRPSGCDFYSLTENLPHWIAPPAGFPWEVLIRGSGPRCEALVERLAEPVVALLADLRVKEVGVTAKGLRIVRQAGEGRRGEHLLLRQAVFDDAEILATDLETILDKLESLRDKVVETRGELVAA
jgi:hypothetical protein